MSYVIAAPEMMTTAATDLAAIGSNVSAAHMVAAARTTSVIPAAADEVSASIAHLFSQHAQDYHAVAAQAAAVQQQFVQNLKTSALSYASVEDAIASFLQGLITSAGSFVNSLNQQLQQLLNELRNVLLYAFLLLFTPIGWFTIFAYVVSGLGLLLDKLLGFLGQFGL
jgi:PE family